MFVNNNMNAPKTIQFDSKSQSSSNCNKKLLDDLRNGIINYDDLSEQQKEYVKQHDSNYRNMFI